MTIAPRRNHLDRGFFSGMAACLEGPAALVLAYLTVDDRMGMAAVVIVRLAILKPIILFEILQAKRQGGLK